MDGWMEIISILEYTFSIKFISHNDKVQTGIKMHDMSFQFDRKSFLGSDSNIRPLVGLGNLKGHQSGADQSVFFILSVRLCFEAEVKS